MSNGAWVCKSCGWRNSSDNLGPYCSALEYKKCGSCKTPRGARPRNVAVIVERTGSGNMKTCKAIASLSAKWRDAGLPSAESADREAAVNTAIHMRSVEGTYPSDDSLSFLRDLGWYLLGFSCGCLATGGAGAIALWVL